MRIIRVGQILTTKQKLRSICSVLCTNSAVVQLPSATKRKVSELSCKKRHLHGALTSEPGVEVGQVVRMQWHL